MIYERHLKHVCSVVHFPCGFKALKMAILTKRTPNKELLKENIELDTRQSLSDLMQNK